MSRYNPATDVHDRATHTIRLVSGRSGARDAVEVRSGGGAVLLPVPSGAGFHSFHSRDTDSLRKTREFVAQVMAGVERDAGRGGWTYSQRTDTWCLVHPERQAETKKRPVPLPVLCCRSVDRSAGRYSQYAACARSVIEGTDACAVHGAADRRNEQRFAAERLQRAEREAEAQRLDRVRGDLRELWVMACEHQGIDRTRADEIRITGSGMMMVDAEILARFLRTIIEQ